MFTSMHTHTCLSNGAELIWLAADTRTIRADAWIQLCHIPQITGVNEIRNPAFS
jgi:hypothetical protein